MRESGATVLSTTRKTSVRTEKSVGYVENSCDSRTIVAISNWNRKKVKPSSEEEVEEEVPKNGYDMSAFFDTECWQGEREPDGDDASEETLRELLSFDFECRQESGNHELNFCIVQN